MVLGAWWWAALAVWTWLVLFAASGPRSLRAFAGGGLWSAGLALLTESLIRERFGFFDAAGFLLPLAGADALLFAGPRFVEGVLFMQTMRPAGQRLRAAGWAAAVTLSETGMAVTGHAHLSPAAFAATLAGHALRFFALLAVFLAGPYALAHERMKRRRERRALAALHRAAWAAGWPAVWAAAALSMAVADLAASRRGRKRPSSLRQG